MSSARPSEAGSISERLSGRILLQVEQHGEAWYVSPPTQKRYYMGRPADAFRLMRSLGLGITDADLARIPVYNDTSEGDTNLRSRLSGRILLQVEQHGEAWYVSPVNQKRYYMGRPADAFQLMRNLGLGISDENLRGISIHQDSTTAPGLDTVGSTGSGYGHNNTACIELPTATGDIVTVSTTAELKAIVSEITGGRGNLTVVINPGTYTIDRGLWIAGENVTFRGATGNRDDVRILGGGMGYGASTHIFMVAADNVTIADMTIGEVYNHAVQVHGESPFDADGFLLHNVRVVDTREQMLKGSYRASDNNGPDNGTVECSVFEYTAGIGPQWYIGGVDVHDGTNWVIRYNTFKDIQSPDSTIAEHGVHFWSNSDGTLVHDNVFINNDRAIGFGLGDYGRGHGSGTIRNNYIYHDTSAGDVGIGLESATDVDVYDNVILHEHDYTRAIEYRFPDTRDGSIYDNILTTGYTITSRDGGTASIGSNTLNARVSDYVNPANGNFDRNE
ncbi:MAG: hypothetical protein KC653_03005, partial [Candidatus Andersenbacteria bacterium]|nr:hypothetical protein [Candidatus Andersenbacteria bacterium]